MTILKKFPQFSYVRCMQWKWHPVSIHNYRNSLNIPLFLFVLFFSLCLIKSDNKSVLNFFLELKLGILNINMQSKIIKDKGTLFHCTLLKFLYESQKTWNLQALIIKSHMYECMMALVEYFLKQMHHSAIFITSMQRLALEWMSLLLAYLKKLRKILYS